MFGYIKPEKPELKIREYEAYKAVYCSLCKALGKEYTPLLRFTLSYDFAFLAMLNLAINQTEIKHEKKRCTCNPLKKCVYCQNTDSFTMPSAAAVIMLYYKLCDNIADEGFFKKIGYFALKLVYRRSYKKAVKNYGYIENIVAEYISKQSILEKNNEASLDSAADPTANALGKIFELCSDNQTHKRVLNRLGYCIGRYIYMLDALNDYESDIKKGSYNPLALNSDFKSLTKDDIIKKIEPKIMLCAVEAQRAYELLEIKNYNSILGNILYLGLEKEINK